MFFLYFYNGYFNERHISLKISDNNFIKPWTRDTPDVQAEKINYSIKLGHPLFLRAQNLYKHSFIFGSEKFYLSFGHKPTIANYWHFQLFTHDSNGQHLPREPKPGEKETKPEEKKLKRLAIMVLEYLISESICQSHEVKKFECGLASA